MEGNSLLHGDPLGRPSLASIAGREPGIQNFPVAHSGTVVRIGRVQLDNRIDVLMSVHGTGTSGVLTFDLQLPIVSVAGVWKVLYQ